MDKESHGMMMEVYRLISSREGNELKGRGMSCKKIKLTHCSMSSLMKMGMR
jgi:hypothetical protein